MNAAACQQAASQVGNGVAASLQGVDCVANSMAAAAFGRLFGSGGALLPALTILLTLYVAFFAFSLVTGRSRIGISALTPRMLTVGMVLTLATSWIAYQSLVWNIANGAPDQIAGIILGAKGSATQLFAQKIDVVFLALVEASGDGAMDGAQSAFSPPGLLWLGGTLLLLGTVGVLVTTKIALAVLLGTGPVFVVLALFQGTRGLFVGWLKGMVMLALAPLFAVLGGSLMLELSVPVLSALTQVPGEIDPRAAMAFFMISAVHVALMILVMKVAGTMVSGWNVFGLANSSDDKGRDTLPGSAPAAPSAPAPRMTSAPAPMGSQRHVAAGGPAIAMAANDTNGSTTSSTREIRVIETGGSKVSPTSSKSRVNGIGSRFRASNSRTSEKIR